MDKESWKTSIFSNPGHCLEAPLPGRCHLLKNALPKSWEKAAQRLLQPGHQMDG
jgi:hypothetical protein